MLTTSLQFSGDSQSLVTPEAAGLLAEVIAMLHYSNMFLKDGHMCTLVCWLDLEFCMKATGKSNDNYVESLYFSLSWVEKVY